MIRTRIAALLRRIAGRLDDRRTTRPHLRLLPADDSRARAAHPSAWRRTS